MPSIKWMRLSFIRLNDFANEPLHSSPTPQPIKEVGQHKSTQDRVVRTAAGILRKEIVSVSQTGPGAEQGRSRAQPVVAFAENEAGNSGEKVHERSGTESEKQDHNVEPQQNFVNLSQFVRISKQLYPRDNQEKNEATAAEQVGKTRPHITVSLPRHILQSRPDSTHTDVRRHEKEQC